MDLEKFILIDAQSLIYQSYYALENMTTSSGKPTGAVFGFYQMLKKILSLYEPGYLLVAFDMGKKTFRHDLFEDYKKHRPSTPELLIPQIEKIKELLSAMQIAYLEKEGYEADDIIATAVNSLSPHYEGKFYVVSSDKDLYQLLTENVRIVRHVAGKFVEFDRKRFEKKYGIHPPQVPDYLALVGDASDNIPGVKGIGPKTATTLLKDYHNIDGILNKLDELDNKRWKNSLHKYEEQALKSRELAYLEKEVPIILEPLSRWKFDNEKMQGEAVNSILRELEFFSLLKDSEEKKVRIPAIHWQWTSAKDFDISSPMAVVYDAHLRGLGFYDGKKGRFLSWEQCRKLSFNEKPIIYAYSVKDMLHLAGEQVPALEDWPFWDIKICEHLLAAHINRLKFEELWEKYLKQVTYPQEKKGVSLFEKQPDMDYLMAKGWGIFQIGGRLQSECRKRSLDNYYQQFEQRLIGVLYRMEKNGIAVDVRRMESFIEELRTNINRLEEEIHKSAGEEFNIQSPKQLQKILFHKLQLKPVKKTKTGYSTDSEVLEVLSIHYPELELPGKILEYRSYSKLLNTYLEPFLQLARKNKGRIQTRFEQTATATGRLSSSEPNLQNIPIKGPWGDKMREVFIPRSGYRLLSADYSQVELRVIAHFSRDERMIEYFRDDKDIHIMTASKIFHCDPQNVTQSMRRVAKAVNFGLIYGKTSFGLAKELKISPAEARQFIERYFEDFSGVKDFIDQLYQKALEEGFVKTLHGRVRFIPELKARNKMLVEAARRQAINTVIQGTAAEIIKLAMINIDTVMQKKGLKSSMTLQIHDELLFEVPPSEKEDIKAIVKKEMEQAIKLEVPLQCSMAWGKNWCKV